MNENNISGPTSEEYRTVLGRKMLNYGLFGSIIGLPVGLLLKMPVVWGLSLLGIIVSGIKLMKRGNQI